MAALALAAGLGVLVSSDAGEAAGLAWSGTALALLVLGLALAAASSSGVSFALAVLAALLLARHDNRLLLAPLYGGALLLIGELGQRSIELRGQTWVASGVVGSRLLAVLLVSGLGACAGAVATLAVTAAPARSVALTAVGTLALLAAVVALTAVARRRAPDRYGDDAPANNPTPDHAILPSSVSGDGVRRASRPNRLRADGS